eukprot:SAG22_NODE_4441_length_1268_cov_2.188195_2_plen_61_part_00
MTRAGGMATFVFKDSLELGGCLHAMEGEGEVCIIVASSAELARDLPTEDFADIVCVKDPA